MRRFALIFSLLAWSVLAYSIALAMLSGCASAPVRTVAEEIPPECLTGEFSPKDPARRFSLAEAIEICEEACAAHGLRWSDTFWIDKGAQVGCRCGCRRIIEDTGRGPKE